MKDKIIKISILIGYCIPYSFLAMQGDAESGTMLFYGIMLICLGILCFMASKFRAIGYAVAGSVLSTVISYICVISFMTEKWSWYFKLFRPTTLVAVISVAALVIQAIVWFILKKKHAISCA